MAKLWGKAIGLCHDVMHSGVEAETPLRLRKQLVVTNLFAVMIGVVTLFWYIVYSMFLRTILDPLMFVVMASAIVVPWLNGRGHLVASRLLLLGVAGAVGAAYAIAMGPEAGIMIMFLPLVCAPLALFDLRDRALIALALPYPIMLAVGVQWYHSDHGALLALPAVVIEHSRTVSLITATALVVATMGFLFSIHASSEARLEQRYRELIRQGEDVVISLAPSGRIVETNREAERVLGYDRGQLVGMHIAEVDRKLSDEHYRALLDRLRREGPQTLRHRYTRRDGSDYPVELRIGLIPDEGGRILAAAHDVSERDELEARLRLADRMVSVGTLAAGVAHEVNNPLAYITLNLTRIRRRLLAAETHLDPEHRREVLESLQMAIEGSEQVSTIVNDLKTFSRGSGDALGAVDVERVLEATLKLADHHLRQRARVIKAFSGVPPVRGNEARLGQVFLNLLLNAAQAMKRGCDVEELWLTTGVAETGEIFLEMRDTGEGIRTQDLPRIFDPFFTTKRDSSGTGLGLYVCRSILEECGGEIRVTSRRGEGTTLWVWLRAAESRRGDYPKKSPMTSYVTPP